MKTAISALLLALLVTGCDRIGTGQVDSDGKSTRGTKTCFNCEGSGKFACAAPGCKDGMVDCPGPCLKLSKGVWKHMHVAGHPDSDVWQGFPQSDGTTQSWNQKHVGEVIEIQGGKAVNVGRCKICGGKARVQCSICGGTGKVVCPICEGRKVVPGNWTAFNNPKQKNPPVTLALKDGRTVVGKIEGRIGSS